MLEKLLGIIGVKKESNSIELENNTGDQSPNSSSQLINEIDKKICILRDELHKELLLAYRNSLTEISDKWGLDNISGIAFGLGYHFEYFRGMSCTHEWIRNEAVSEASRSIFVEWPNYVGFELFDMVLRKCIDINELKYEMLETLDYSSEADAYDLKEAEIRFKIFVDTLKDVRDDENIDYSILMIIASEDGVCNDRFKYMIHALNTEENIINVLKDIGVH